MKTRSNFRAHAIERDPTRDRWVQAETYGLRFWLPILGRDAYLTWLILKSYCWDTDYCWPTLSTISRTISNSDNNRRILTGRRRGEDYQPGALDILQEHEIITIKTTGDATTLTYHFYILKTLPRLRPDQILLLSQQLQHDHKRWLDQFDIKSSPLGEATGPTPEATGPTPVATGTTNKNQNQDTEQEAKEQWDTIKKMLKQHLFENVYTQWLHNSCGHHTDGTTLTVTCPKASAEFITKRLHNIVRQAVADAHTDIHEVIFIAAED